MYFLFSSCLKEQTQATSTYSICLPLELTEITKVSITDSRGHVLDLLGCLYWVLGMVNVLKF